MPFSGVTKSGRVWRKVPESDARSVDSLVDSKRLQLADGKNTRYWALCFAMVSSLVSHFQCKVLAMVVPRNLNESTSSNCCSLIANGVIAALFFLKSMIISGFVFATFSSRSLLVHQ